MKAVKEQLEKRKATLEAAKTKGGEGWTAKLQEELDNLALALVDVEEIYEEKVETTRIQPKDQAPVQEDKYVPVKGTEKSVHVKLIKGRRFNSLTGEEVSAPYVQIFSFGEWQLFKKNFKSLGYLIIEALHDPYGDAAALVTKLK